MLTGALLGISGAPRSFGLVAGAATPLGTAAGGIVGDLTRRSIPVIYLVVGALATLADLAISAHPTFRDFLATDF